MVVGGGSSSQVRVVQVVEVGATMPDDRRSGQRQTNGGRRCDGAASIVSDR